MGRVLSSVHASDGRGKGAIERADQCRRRHAQPVVQQYPALQGRADEGRHSHDPQTFFGGVVSLADRSDKQFRRGRHGLFQAAKRAVLFLIAEKFEFIPISPPVG
jgi:hypothetical protein